MKNFPKKTKEKNSVFLRENIEFIHSQPIGKQQTILVQSSVSGNNQEVRPIEIVYKPNSTEFYEHQNILSDPVNPPTNTIQFPDILDCSEFSNQHSPALTRQAKLLLPLAPALELESKRN